jgi:tetratricopeptide (TPR) repeat protein
MNEADKVAARRMLEEKKLTIEQVEQIRVEVDRTGRPFHEIAAARAVPAPRPPRATPIPILYQALLAASVLIFAGLLIATIVRMRERTRKDDDLAIESEKSNSDSDRKAAEARRGYNQSLVAAKETDAQQSLVKARAAMARVESMLGTGTLPPELTVALNEAFIAYNQYLRIFPDDAVVCVERAKTHEMRRNFDLAIADLEHAIVVQPALEPALRDRIAKARLMLSRKPQ